MPDKALSLCEIDPAVKLVTPAQVSGAISEWKSWVQLASVPTKSPGEVRKDHKAFFIGCVFPIIDLPLSVRRIATEAYLADYEAIADGSSVVPESYRYGNTKDWQGVMHDYIFYLHHKGLRDAYGHKWTLWEANAAYRLGWICDGQPLRGNAWWLGLTLASAFVWYRPK